MSILVDQDTRVIVQGITGREGQVATDLMLAYGTQVLAGVTPGKAGQEVHGVPVYNTVRAAMRDCPVNTSLVYVPPAFAADSIYEAVDAGIKLIVVITERIPLHDLAKALGYARRAGARVVGPNTLGVISPGKAKVGPIGGRNVDRCFQPGPVGVISRSGGMTTETAWLAKEAGYGCSTCVGIGGSPLLGMAFREYLELYQQDPGTDVVVLFGEAGSGYEEEVTRFVADGGYTKPLVAYIGGEFSEAMNSGAKFGHASTIVERAIGSPSQKKALLRSVGAHVVEEYDEIIPVLQKILG